MTDDTPPPQHFIFWAAVFEGLVAVVAVVLGWLFATPALATFAWSWADLGWGVLAIVPPLGLLWCCLVVPWRPFQRLVLVVDEQMLPMFASVNAVEIAVVCVLAGLGEEMLFRSVVQAVAADWSARWLGWPVGVSLGLAASAILFGLAHAVTRTYLVLAALIGLYFGAVWLWVGNLLVPIVAHAGYDFVALVYLLNRHRRQPAEPDAAD